MILGASVPLCCGVLFPCWVLRHVRAQYQCYCRRHGQSDKRNVCCRKNSYASPKSPVLIKSSSSTLLYPSFCWNDAETGYRVVRLAPKTQISKSRLAHLDFDGKLNSKPDLFSSIFWFEHFFCCKNVILCFALFTRKNAQNRSENEQNWIFKIWKWY